MSIASNAWIYKLAHTFADRLTASTAPVKVSCNSNFFGGNATAYRVLISGNLQTLHAFITRTQANTNTSKIYIFFEHFFTLPQALLVSFSSHLSSPVSELCQRVYGRGRLDILRWAELSGSQSSMSGNATRPLATADALFVFQHGASWTRLLHGACCIW